MASLAIIIPAYKDTYLKVALDSIAAQTCHDFVLYIGDDCSPFQLEPIVEGYKDKINLVYQRFDTNLGGTDLVAQWERCIAMSMDEPYIWLFSDDDVMDPNCVEEFLKHLKKTRGLYDLYHFDINEINESGEVTRQMCNYPDVLQAYDYYKGKIFGKYPSYVVENIFSRKVYDQSGGFKNFDLAWGSDTATWAMFCGKKGMFKIPSAHVNWRRSSQNISPNRTRPISERKIMAVCNFLDWSYGYFSDQPDIFSVNRRMFVRRMKVFKKHISNECFKKVFSEFFRVHGHNRYKWVVYLQIMLHL